MALMPLTDALFLLAEFREKPMHVGGLQLFTPPEGAGPDFAGELYHRVVREADQVAPLFCKYPARALGGIGPWTWELDPKLDLEYHVRHSALPHPGRVRELLALVSRLHGTLLDRNRPLWEAHVIEGLADGRMALYTKIHHALLDGVSAMRLLAKALSTDPDERDLPAPWSLRRERTSRPGTGGGGIHPGMLARGVLTGGRVAAEASLAALRSTLRSLEDQAARMPFQAPRTIFNVPITGARRFAADAYEMARVRHVAQATGGTVNDVILAMCAGALRRYLLDQDALPEQPLVAAVPVSLRTADDAREGGNAVGIALCNLGTNLAAAEDRLALIQRSMGEAKGRLKDLHPASVLALSALSFAPLPLAMTPLYRLEPLRRPPFNVLISNVPGPTEPLYWNGARLDGIYPVSIPFDGLALNITVTSYAGSLEFGLVGCRRSVPQLQRMLGHLETSLEELEGLTGRG